MRTAAVTVTLAAACLVLLPGQARTDAGLVRIFAVTHAVAQANVGPDRRSAGDLTVFGSRLHDRAGTPIGWASLACMFLGRSLPAHTSQCQGTYSLPRGKIMVAGTRQRVDYYLLAVVGGTGIYSRATGVLIVSTVDRNPRRERLLFSLES